MEEENTNIKNTDFGQEQTDDIAIENDITLADTPFPSAQEEEYIKILNEKRMAISGFIVFSIVVLLFSIIFLALTISCEQSKSTENYSSACYGQGLFFVFLAPPCGIAALISLIFSLVKTFSFSSHKKNYEKKYTQEWSKKIMSPPLQMQKGKSPIIYWVIGSILGVIGLNMLSPFLFVVSINGIPYNFEIIFFIAILLFIITILLIRLGKERTKKQ